MVDLMPKRRGWQLGLGLAMVALGLLTLGFAPAVGILSTALLGLAIIVGGGVAIVGIFRSESAAETLMMILLAAMLLFTGVALVADPVRALVATSTLVGTYLLLGGVARIVIAMFDRRGNRGWAALHGVVSLLLGVLFWAKWPVSGLVAIGLVLGIELIFVGVSWIVGTRATRDEPQSRRSTHTSRKRRSARQRARG
jgi:uncharacterized membrane protein HdeD (DUF308 family)